MKDYIFKILIPVFCLISSVNICGEELQVALASNFKIAMVSLKEEFESQSKHQINLSAGSTGKHYAQIIHGAPYDLFFAADEKRPGL